MSAITTIEVRVYYEDTDLSGVVYHVNYLRYFERGRTEAMRAAGGTHVALLTADEPVAYTVTEIAVRYRRGARVDDLLTVETTLAEVRGARLRFAQRALLDGAELAAADVTVACMSLDGRPRRLPPEQRRLFEAALG